MQKIHAVFSRKLAILWIKMLKSTGKKFFDKFFNISE